MPVRKRDLWVLPHDYSCGGYYVAERYPAGIDLHLKSQIYNDNLSFWLLTGREVLNTTQVETMLNHCRSRGEEVSVTWENSLPDGARWLNVR